MTSETHICHVFATFSPGGPQVRMSQIINALNGKWRHTIVAMDHKMEAQSLLSDTVKVQYVYPNYKESDPFSILHMARLLRRLKPDILVTYNWGAIEAIAAAKLIRLRRIIHGEYGFRPDEASGNQKRRRVLARRLLLRNVQALIVPSYKLAKIAEIVWRIPIHRVVHIPNGVDCNFFSPGDGSAQRLKLGIDPSDFVVGTVAHLRKEKNLRLLVDIFAMVPSHLRIHLILVGDGPEKEDLIERAKQKGVGHRIHFLGHCSQPMEIYRTMDVFALTSMTEQMPVSVLEAMAAGLPILSTDVGDIKKMVSVGNRPFIVALSDKSGYLEALTNLANNEALRHKIGTKNREKCIREFNSSQMIESYHKLYKSVLAL